MWIDLHTNSDKIISCEKEGDEMIKYIIKNFPKNKIKYILDIGGGLSIRSAIIAKYFNAKLYILDGDISNNNNNQIRDTSTGSPNNFKFYFSFNEIKNMVDKYNIDYEIINVKNIIIPNDLKFDLILSFRSCGFHYPFETYNDIYKKNSSIDTLFIFDIRNSYKFTYKIIDNIEIGKKHKRIIFQSDGVL